MKLLRYIARFYLSKFPITEGKKYIYLLSKKYLLPSVMNLFSMTKHDFYLKLNLKNPEHQYYFFYMSHDERYEIRCLQKIINERDVCWDIGANIGFYSFLLASIVKNGEVIAFEPVFKTFSDLKDGCYKNDFNNIFLNNYALGAKCEDREIFFSNQNLSIGTASFLDSEEFINSEIVHINMIDKIYNGLKTPDFLKIDVEGFQNDVVKGGNIFFQNNSPLIMIEIDHDTDKSLEDFFIKIGYHFYRFHKNYITQVDSIFNNGRNILFCKPESKYFKRIESILYE
jgi:FkbM family methyltransferase